jgi:DNA-binding NtrC family response regulator
LLKQELDIVVVDDEQLITDILTGFISLEAPQARVHVFNCPAKARDFISANPVDILITDYSMQKLDGMQLAAAAPANARKVVLTGFASEIAEKEMKALNVTVLGKPVPLEVLGKIIGEEMGRCGR